MQTHLLAIQASDCSKCVKLFISKLMRNFDQFYLQLVDYNIFNYLIPREKKESLSNRTQPNLN